MLGATKGLSSYNSRMVEIEVTGLCRQEIIRASNYRVKVPYSRLSQTMQEIARMGGKIKGVRMLSSSLGVSPASEEPVSSETTEGSQTEVLETAGSETDLSETDLSETDLSETEVSETATRASSDLTEVKPVRSLRKSVEAKKKSATKKSRLKKLKRKPKSQK